MPNTCKSNEKPDFDWVESGARVSNTWLTYPSEGDNHGKLWLRPRMLTVVRGAVRKATVLREGAVAHQLVGRVTAYQGEDG